MLPMRVSGSSMTISSGVDRLGKGRATGFDNAGAAQTTDSGNSPHAAAISPEAMSSRSRTGSAGDGSRSVVGGSSAHGDWIGFQHAGQGPLMPAILSGTLSLMPQAGQGKIRESVAIRVTAL